MKRGVLWTVVSVLLLAGVSGLVFWDYVNYLETPVGSESQQVKVVITQGSTLSQVVSALQDKELVLGPTYFRLYLLINDLADKLKAGVYYFNVKMTPEDIALMLYEGPKTPYNVVTVTEGYNIWQVAGAFEDAGVSSAEKLLAAASDPGFASRWGVKVPDAGKVHALLEGYVFPETYYIAPGQKFENILGRMVKQTFKELRQAKRKHINEFALLVEEFGFSDYELIVLASLIERETALPHEKKLVASVFLNRLRKGMLLQTDPTLTYTPERKGAKPTPDDRKNEENLYNTYAHGGLPPGPICNPGRDSLEGVVAPARSRFFYFVSKMDGTGGHHFSTNYDDHKKAVRKYLKKK